MSAWRSYRRVVWLLPIVVLVCTLMVLPAGAILSPGRGASSASAAAATGSTAPSAPLTGLLGSASDSAGGTSYASSPESPALSTLAAPNTPWVNSLLQRPEAQKTVPLASVPNINILGGHSVPVVNGMVVPSDVAQPSPMGLADYGLGASNAYAYNSSHINGQLALNAAPNDTNPGAFSLISPAGGTLGYISSTYVFGVQLNTILTNISIPGTQDGTFWTQNVLDVSDTGIHFVDDTFNNTLGSGWYLASGTITSGCLGSNVDDILYEYGGVFQCVGETIPISPSDYPLTISLYNNVTVNSAHQDVLSYGYRFTGAGGFVETGVSDEIIFNNSAGLTPLAPGFEVNGYYGDPVGAFYDSEMDIVGGIGGDNAVFRALNGSLTLQYSNDSAGGWQSIPSGYDFGDDTGETSTGIAAYYVGHTEYINQGPSFLYGLWNAISWGSVGPGAIQFQGSITPDFGFVFVSNLAADAYSTNFSWVPTNATGVFDTFLPAGGILTGPDYYVQSFAPGYGEVNSSAFSTSVTGYAISLPAALGNPRAPLYMLSNGQASGIEDALSGVTTTPYTFDDLEIDMNLTFAHVNDYLYPSFVIFDAEGVTAGLNVSDIYEGPNSGIFGAGSTAMVYNQPTSGPTEGFLYPGAGFLDAGPFYFGQFQIMQVAHANVSELELLGQEPYGAPYADEGGLVFLWHDTGASVTDYLSAPETAGSWGVFNGESVGTSASDFTTGPDSNGFDDISSSGSSVTSVFVIGADAFGIYVLDSTDGSYSWINATESAYGVYTGEGAGGLPYYAIPGAIDTSIDDLNATYDALGAYLGVSTDVSVTDAGTWMEAGAVIIDQSSHTTVTNVDAYDAWGVDIYDGADNTTIANYYAASPDLSGSTSAVFENAVDTTLTNVTIFDYTQGFEVDGSIATSFTDLRLNDTEYGYAGGDNIGDYFTNTWVNDSEYGINVTGDINIAATNFWVNDSYAGSWNFFTESATYTNVWVYESYVGVSEQYSAGVTITNIHVLGGFGGFWLPYTTGSSITDLTSNGAEVGGEVDYAPGGNVQDATGVDTPSVFVAFVDTDFNVTDVTTTDSITAEGTGGVVLISGSSDHVSDVTASDDAVGVGVVGGASNDVISDVTSSQMGVGVLIDQASGISVSDVTTSNVAVGVFDQDSSGDSVTGVTVSDVAIGVYGLETTGLVVSGVTATNDTLSSPYASEDLGGPFAAVVTDETDYTTLTGITATTYSAAWYDIDSDYASVSDVNATGSYYAAVLNDTDYSLLSGIGAFQDQVGVLGTDDYENVITSSAFVGNSGFGVDLINGDYTTVYNNNFIANNGATSVYDPAHIQAFSSGYNYFNLDEIGNYWADWHSYDQYGDLAPYFVSGEVWDYYPLGTPEGTYAVYFEESGLAPGASWSVTLNGVAQTTTNSYILFGEFPGTYAFSVAAPTGYSVTPATGSLLVGTGAVYVDLSFTAQYAVTFTATGLASGASWWVTLGGVTQTATTAAIVFTVGAGTYAFQAGGPAGFSAAPSTGSVTVVASNYAVTIAFAPVLYAVTLTEGGLASGTAWSATVNGVTQTTSGTALTFYLANGTYTYTYAAVSGYSLGTGGSGSVTVAGVPVAVSTTYSATSTPAVASSSNLNTYFAIALAIAVIALVVALLALLMRRGKASSAPANNPPAAWTPPAASSGGTPGGSSAWSEGAGPGTPPPSS